MNFPLGGDPSQGAHFAHNQAQPPMQMQQGLMQGFAGNMQQQFHYNMIMAQCQLNQQLQAQQTQRQQPQLQLPQLPRQQAFPQMQSPIFPGIPMFPQFGQQMQMPPTPQKPLQQPQFPYPTPFLSPQSQSAQMAFHQAQMQLQQMQQQGRMREMMQQGQLQNQQQNHHQQGFARYPPPAYSQSHTNPQEEDQRQKLMAFDCRNQQFLNAQMPLFPTMHNHPTQKPPTEAKPDGMPHLVPYPNGMPQLRPIAIPTPSSSNGCLSRSGDAVLLTPQSNGPRVVPGFTDQSRRGSMDEDAKPTLAQLHHLHQLNLQQHQMQQPQLQQPQVQVPANNFQMARPIKTEVVEDEDCVILNVVPGKPQRQNQNTQAMAPPSISAEQEVKTEALDHGQQLMNFCQPLLLLAQGVPQNVQVHQNAGAPVAYPVMCGVVPPPQIFRQELEPQNLQMAEDCVIERALNIVDPPIQQVKKEVQPQEEQIHDDPPAFDICRTVDPPMLVAKRERLYQEEMAARQAQVQVPEKPVKAEQVEAPMEQNVPAVVVPKPMESTAEKVKKEQGEMPIVAPKPTNSATQPQVSDPKPISAAQKTESIEKPAVPSSEDGAPVAYEFKMEEKQIVASPLMKLLEEEEGEPKGPTYLAPEIKQLLGELDFVPQVSPPAQETMDEDDDEEEDSGVYDHDSGPEEEEKEEVPQKKEAPIQKDIMYRTIRAMSRPLPNFKILDERGIPKKQWKTYCLQCLSMKMTKIHAKSTDCFNRTCNYERWRQSDYSYALELWYEQRQEVEKRREAKLQEEKLVAIQQKANNHREDQESLLRGQVRDLEEEIEEDRRREAEGPSASPQKSPRKPKHCTKCRAHYVEVEQRGHTVCEFANCKCGSARCVKVDKTRNQNNVKNHIQKRNNERRAYQEYGNTVDWEKASPRDKKTGVSYRPHH